MKWRNGPEMKCSYQKTIPDALHHMWAECAAALLLSYLVKFDQIFLHYILTLTLAFYSIP
jgi:hypothetical protein